MTEKPVSQRVFEFGDKVRKYRLFPFGKRHLADQIKQIGHDVADLERRLEQAEDTIRDNIRSVAEMEEKVLGLPDDEIWAPGSVTVKGVCLEVTAEIYRLRTERDEAYDKGFHDGQLHPMR